MSLRTAERRRAVRVPAVFPATLRDRRGRLLARGRTADISERGTLIMAKAQRGDPRLGEAFLEMSLPTPSEVCPRRHGQRIVHYLCRIVRVQPLGQLVGLGVEFLQKLA